MIIFSLLFKTIKNLFECLVYKPTIGFFKLKEDGRDLLFHLGFFRHFETTNGDVKNEGKFCVFASYQPSGVNPLLLYYIKYLKEVMGFAVAFISNCKLSDEDKQKLKPYTYKIVERANVGRDFGAYKFGILHFKEEIKSSNLFLIANDSVYGPIQDLTPFLRKMEEGYDVVSDIEVANHKIIHEPHLGSYFIIMNKKVVNSKYFWQFWQKIKYLSNRYFCIHKGEVKLSQLVLSKFRSTALFSSYHLVKKWVELGLIEKKMFLFSAKEASFVNNRESISTFETMVIVSPNLYPNVVLQSGGFFVKRDWVKKVVIASYLISILDKIEFSTDMDKDFLINQLNKDSFINKKTIKLMQKGLL